VAEGGAIMTRLADEAEAERRVMEMGGSKHDHLKDIRSERKRTSNGHQKPDGSHRFKDTAGQKEGERFDDGDLIANGWTATVYDYKLPDGTLLYQQNRYDPLMRAGVDAPNKKYLPTRPDGKHRVFGPGQRRILYNWPAIIRAGPGATVFVTEGEKNADDLIKRNLLATTVISHEWREECVAALTGYDLIILADHDKDGEREANTAHGVLSKVAKTIRVVPFLHLWKQLSPNKEPPSNYDVSDWLDCGGDAKKLAEICRELPADGAIVAVPHNFPAEASLPLWEFLYGSHLLRKTVSGTAAMGATGKSSLSIVEALAMTIGRPLLKFSVPAEPLRVLLINLEDNREAVDKRIAAAMKHYKLTPSDIGGRLFTQAKGELKFKIAAQLRIGSVVRNEPNIKGMIGFLIENKIDVFSIDPFISTHAVNENDNSAIRSVIEIYDEIAEAANCAVSIWHHTRKANGAEASIDSARGAGSFADACRSIRILETMTAAEARKNELPKHSQYFRSFSGKLNFAPPTDKSDWFQIVSISLDNGGGDDLFGDDIGVVETWTLLANEKQELSMSEVSNICREVAKAEWREDVRSSMWVGKAVATALNLSADDNKEKIKGILKTMLKSGMLKTRPGKASNGHDAIFIEVGSFSGSGPNEHG
jgi:AAA domain-containing protein